MAPELLCVKTKKSMKLFKKTKFYSPRLSQALIVFSKFFNLRQLDLVPK